MALRMAFLIIIAAVAAALAFDLTVRDGAGTNFYFKTSPCYWPRMKMILKTSLYEMKSILYVVIYMLVREMIVG
ncbi:hypothetical protein ABFS82_05G092400 [Erythranthe guttata]